MGCRPKPDGDGLTEKRCRCPTGWRERRATGGDRRRSLRKEPAKALRTGSPALHSTKSERLHRAADLAACARHANHNTP